MTSLVCLYPLSKFLWESAQGGVIQLRVAFQAIDALCQTSQRLGGFGKFWSQMAGNQATKTTMASGTGSYFSLFFVENSCVTCFLSSYINAILSKHFATWVGDWGMIIPQRHSNYYYWEKHKGSSNRESKGVVITGNVTGVTVSVLMIHDHPNRLHTGSPLAKPVQFSKKNKSQKHLPQSETILCCLDQPLYSIAQRSTESCWNPPSSSKCGCFIPISHKLHHVSYKKMLPKATSTTAVWILLYPITPFFPRTKTDF